MGARHRGKDIVKKMTKQYESAFDSIIKCTGEKKTNQPLPCSYGMAENGRPVPKKEGLFDPDNKQTQTILWLYSIEPSMYTDINKAVRENNQSSLDNLGPIAYAMYWIVKIAEINKSQKITLGSKLHKPEKDLTHELGTWCCSDLVFRGALMDEIWIDSWKQKIGNKGLRKMDTGEIEEENKEKPAYVCMKGITSTTESFRVALKQLLPIDDRYKPVIFVISL